MSTTPQDAPPLPASICRLIDRAKSLCHRGEVGDGFALFEVAIEADPTPTAKIAFARQLAESDPARAIAEFQSAWELACTQFAADERAVCCRNLATLHDRRGEPSLALQYQQLAIAAEMETDQFVSDATFSAELLTTVGESWLTDGDAVDGDALLSAVEHRVENDGHRMATIAAQRGVVAARDERPLEALRHLLKAHRLYRQFGDDDARAHTLTNLGHVLQARQKLSAARICFREAAGLFDSLGDAERARQASAFGRETAIRIAFDTANPQWN